MSQELGIKIRELRKKRGLTQKRLAEAINIDFTYLSKIENNTLPYSPSTETLKKLSKILDVDELELLSLAGKLPAGLDTLTKSKQGVRFLRQASDVKPEEWDELLSYLEERRKQKSS
jgi:transcriptional regulator with XRE-family HTH domain